MNDMIELMKSVDKLKYMIALKDAADKLKYMLDLDENKKKDKLEEYMKNLTDKDIIEIASFINFSGFKVTSEFLIEKFVERSKNIVGLKSEVKEIDKYEMVMNSLEHICYLVNSSKDMVNGIEECCSNHKIMRDYLEDILNGFDIDGVLEKIKNMGEYLLSITMKDNTIH